MAIQAQRRLRAVGYIRVSTGAQAGGVSLKAQRARIEAWAVGNGAQLVGMHCDAGLSGGRTDNRPGLQAALTAARQSGAALVVYSLSRLARSTVDAIAVSESLGRSGASLISLSESLDTTTAAGKMMFRLLAVLAEFERDIIAERTAAALHYKRARREYTGGEPPYCGGWRATAGAWSPTPRNKRRSARRLRRAGLSLRHVGAHLAAAGVDPRHGGRWHAKTVHALLLAKARRGCAGPWP